MMLVPIKRALGGGDSVFQYRLVADYLIAL